MKFNQLVSVTGILTFLCLQKVFCQVTTITGKVTSVDDKPIEGVSVQSK